MCETAGIYQGLSSPTLANVGKDQSLRIRWVGVKNCPHYITNGFLVTNNYNHIPLNVQLNNGIAHNF